MKRLFFAIIIFSLFNIYAQDRPDALQKYREGNYTEAVRICLMELEAMPRNMDSYAVLCWSLVRLERYSEALSYGKRGLSISPSDVRMIQIVGEAHYYLGQYLEALKQFEEYTVLAPTGDRISDVYFFMGQIFIQFGEYNKADIALTTSVYYNPNVARWWARLGYAREMAEDFKHSLEAYDTALKLNPSLTEAQRGRERVNTRLRSR